eukprot:TRINITY_DN34142_c0_g1_i1.p1 TRINITY_DN34142_c0_g1~~TRINITY_DN34142_c0_g1_i1.p1  ORF type:complete len:319 (-),score=53.00 TRINITY_DN34142_c0_g1_i1:179-1135(-)
MAPLPTSFEEFTKLHAALLATESGAHESIRQELRRDVKLRAPLSTDEAGPVKPAPLQRRGPSSRNWLVCEEEATPSASSSVPPAVRGEKVQIDLVEQVHPSSSSRCKMGRLSDDAARPAFLAEEQSGLGSGERLEGGHPVARLCFLRRRFKHLVAFMCFVTLTLGVLLAALCAIELLPASTLAWLEGRETLHHERGALPSVDEEAETAASWEDASKIGEVKEEVRFPFGTTAATASAAVAAETHSASKEAAVPAACRDVAKVSQCRASKRCCPGGPGAAHCGRLDCAWDEVRQAYNCPGSWMRDNCALSCGLCDGARS